jgi:hypothetical protein
MASLSDKYKNNLPFESSNITTIISDYTALNNDVVFVNTASSALTVTLPESPTAGSKIKVIDVSANAQNNIITVLGNGYNVGGASAYLINTPDSSAEFLFINNTKGWNVLNEYISITKPQAPTEILAVNIGTSRAYNDGAATVSFAPSASGDPATSYTVISTPGSFSATGTSSPLLVTGLQSNTSYTFKVYATNAAGNSPESTASSSITATTVPQAPLMGTATDVGTSRAYNNGAATVEFTPQATGGSPITSYTVSSNIGGYTGTGSSSPITTTGLQSTSSYTFTVTATNANGTSISSGSSNSITATTVPQAPTIGTATYGFEKAIIAFTNNQNGGKSITTNTATSSPTSLTGSSATSPITISSLTGGTSYTFTVTATNANGTSTASSASNSTTPFTASGGSTTTSGGYRIHTFTSSSSFTLTGNSATCDYLVIAGGGGGGRNGGGGGGAGGFRCTVDATGGGGTLESPISLTAQTYSVTIGAGGGGSSGGGNASSGNSSIFHTITSIGGGLGAGREGTVNAASGGSGGGGTGIQSGNPGGAGGAGTSGQGFAGGNGTNYSAGSNAAGGGGGGASASGASAGSNAPGKGGNGVLTTINGSAVTRAGGGGGGSNGTASGGTGGGGSSGSTGVSGTNNTGSGGGAATGGFTSGGAGGSGIVIIRYAV